MIKIRDIGWYLLSTSQGETLQALLNRYKYFTYLDISIAYVPLYADISSGMTFPSDFSFNINSETTTNINPSDLSFNYTLGNVIDSDSFKKPFLGKINRFDEPFNDSFGIWIYMYNPDTIPILDISLNNNAIIPYDNEAESKRPIIKLTINDVSDININNDTIDLSFTQDSSVNIIFERSFNFNFNTIFRNYIVRNNEYINFNRLDSSNTLVFSTNFSGEDFNQTLNTSSLDTSADISFTIFNSNPSQIGEKFTVNFKIDISDTIYPSIDFNASQQHGFTFEKKIFTDINNNVNVSIPQSVIRNTITNNYRPKVFFFDQNQRDVDVSYSHIINLPSNIVDPNTSSSHTISYETGKWHAGIYNFRYQCGDLLDKTTIVDLSLEIIDDLQPTINITDCSLNTINAYLTNLPNRNNNNYDNTNIPSGDSDISGVGFTLSHVFTNTNNDFDSNTTRDFHFKFSELSGNNWYFSDVSSVIDWSNVNITNTVLKSNSILSWPDNDLSNNYFFTNSDISYALRQQSFDNNNPNIKRTYITSDNNYNYTTLTTNYFIWDDTIPIVDVSFIHTIFKIDTSKAAYNANLNNNVYGDLTSILDSNVIQSNPIVINLYDDIEFKFSMNKECMCKVVLSSHTITQDSVDYQSTHSINLNHTHTDNIGIQDLTFTIWDKNNNFFKFKYDISINDIPSYTLKIIEDQYESISNKKQKLLLRVTERNAFYTFFVRMWIETDRSKNNPAWDTVDFSDKALIYQGNKFNFFNNYQKSFNGITGKFSVNINNSSTAGTQEFIQTSIINGIYYELLYFPYDPVLNITKILEFWVSDVQEYGSIALGVNNYTDISNNIGFYNNNSDNIQYNSL